jgi:hypothetical protein
LKKEKTVTTLRFEDVRKGDRIKVTLHAQDTIQTREGTAHTKGLHVTDWKTPNGWWLGMDYDDAVIELLERPKSREQQLWEEVRMSGYAVEDINNLPAEHPVTKLINKIVELEKAK